MNFRDRAAGLAGLTVFGLLVVGSATFAQPMAKTAGSCAGSNSGIALSPGFCATVFADNIGHALHLVVASNGVVYVNTWSGRYYHNAAPPEGGFLVALKDTSGSGHADVVERFGPTAADGAAGGTGIALYQGAVYAEVNDRIVRYALSDDAIVPKGPPEVVVSACRSPAITRCTLS